MKHSGDAIRNICIEDSMSIDLFYLLFVSQKACQRLQMKRVFETKIVFLLDYFICVPGNPCFKDISIHNDQLLEGFVKFK